MESLEGWEGRPESRSQTVSLPLAPVACCGSCCLYIEEAGPSLPSVDRWPVPAMLQTGPSLVAETRGSSSSPLEETALGCLELNSRWFWGWDITRPISQPLDSGPVSAALGAPSPGQQQEPEPGCLPWSCSAHCAGVHRERAPGGPQVLLAPETSPSIPVSHHTGPADPTGWLLGRAWQRPKG